MPSKEAANVAYVLLVYTIVADWSDLKQKIGS